MSRKNMKKEYILFELIEWNNGELNYSTKPVSEQDSEFIVYEQFAKEKHNSKIEEMDLIPHIIEDDVFKITMLVYPLINKEELADIQVEMFEFLREYK